MDGEGTVVGGRYTLLRRLGRGGMAEVWLASDSRLGDKHVAVKRLLGYRSDSPDAQQDVERARREALAASRLNHGNLVAVTDFVAEDGEPFIVMEYVEGDTLSGVIDRGLPVPRAARIIGQVAGAVAAAHEAGIIHRDIKPANIMVTRRDVAKLADFGIARSVGDTRLTRTGYFTGTVGYLAPELLDGSDASSASDVWALGAVLFETVEGRAAFQGDTTPTLIAAIVLRDLPVPQHAPELAPLVARMLERDPARRIGIDEVVTELAAVAARTERPRGTALPSSPPAAPTTVRAAPVAPPAPPSGPPPAAPPSPLPPVPAPPSRSRRGWWVAAAVVLVLIAAGIVAVVARGGGGTPSAAGSTSPRTSAAPTVAGSSAASSATPSTAAATDTPGPLRVLAHRGGRENHAEESIPALVQAAKDGYGVETDIRWTSDGVPVIVHDATTKANLVCSGGPYTVSTTTWAVLRERCRTPAAASPDGKTYPIGTFEDLGKALEPVATGTLFVEVKVDQTQKQVDGFLSVLTRHDLVDRTVVTSFFAVELAKMRDAATALGTTLTLLRFVSDTRTSAATFKAAGLRYVAVEAAAATRKYLSTLKAAGLVTVVWTVDTEAQWAAARAAGADLVLTDVPAAYLRWLADQ